MSEPERKCRRRIKACDNCVKRKTKCYWRPSSCVDCIRLGISCTFKSVDNHYGDEEPSLAVSYHQPKRFEISVSDAAALSQEQQTPLESGVHLGNPISQIVFEAGTKRLEGNEHHRVVERYFAGSNHCFPVFSKDAFLERMRNPRKQTADEDPAWWACLNAVLCLSCQQQYIADPGSPPVSSEDAARYMHNALAVVDRSIFGRPTMSAVQALLGLVLCMPNRQPDDQRCTSLLAIAVHMAYSLRLHRSNEVANISTEVRLEQIRVFWCLYSLDRETSICNGFAPFIDEDDIFVLEPKRYSEDECGLVQSLNDTGSLNLFVARQRLSRIEYVIWKELRTFKALRQPILRQAVATSRVNKSLADWKTEWFEFGQPNTLSEAWPSSAIISITQIQFLYFQCLLRANPDVRCNAKEAEDNFQQIKGVDDVAFHRTEALARVTQCAVAARETLRMGMTEGTGWPRDLCNAIRYAVPASVILLTGIPAGLNKQQHGSDIVLVNSWLDACGHLTDKGDDDEPKRLIHSCQRLVELAGRAVGDGYDTVVGVANT